ncbi:branched-chain amino acid ABC transporter permease [Variovorax sp. J31P207]|uniref:branched-chain amino acid ABC transporter permease n=1 Tax=Variovorax sp. J31P207 TaxID=3053510 RepID=UPI002576ED4D|nr:branched-chain amino acid ABC transporter permease [Variovorax sp. J31P207]MDM0071545.1 branched-chain amino acid ABC transporter permease [Variovorax sp. J31P207]
MDALIQALISGLAVGGMYALVALGFSITFTTTRTMNFAQGDFVSVGTFLGLSAMLLLQGSGPLHIVSSDAVFPGWVQLVGVLAATLLVGLLGVAMYTSAVRPFAGKPGMSWVMSTIGFGIILASVALAIWGPAPRKMPAPFGEEVMRFGGAGIRPQEILMLAVALVVMAVFDWVLRKTMTGQAMRAVAHSPEVARLMGVNVGVLMIGAYFVSCCLAGLAGVLVAPITGASLYIGVTIGLKGFSGAIVGGLSNPRGCAIGGFLIGLLESLVSLWQSQWREVVVFALVILVLAIRPTGLFGTRTVEKV